MTNSLFMKLPSTALFLFVALIPSSCNHSPKENQKISNLPKSYSDLVGPLNGINVNYPNSEKLNWMPVNEKNSIDPKYIELAMPHIIPSIVKEHKLRVHRYTTIGDYVLLCGNYYPPFPDGSHCWVINTKTMKYIGHFFDKNSR